MKKQNAHAMRGLLLFRTQVFQYLKADNRMTHAGFLWLETQKMAKSKYESYTHAQLVEELKKLNKRKKYGLVWEEEKTKEKLLELGYIINETNYGGRNYGWLLIKLNTNLSGLL